MSYSFSQMAAAKRAAVVCAVAIATLAIWAPNAQANSVGLDVAYVSPEGFDGTFGFGAFLNLSAPMLPFQVEPFASYWSRTEGESGAQASLSDLTLGARGKYAIALPGAPVQPYLGLGLGLHFMKAETDVTILNEISNLSVTDSEFGIDLGGGASIPVSPTISIRGEGWYSFVGDATWASARLGVMFSM